MSDKVYIHVERQNKNTVKHVYVNSDGEVIKESVPYRQKIWEYTMATDQPWKDIHGKQLECIEIDILKDYVEEHKYLRGHDFAGELDVKYQFIADQYKGDIDFDFEKINKCYWDIEVKTTNDKGESTGFPDPWIANQKIISIAFYMTKTQEKHVFGLKDYTGDDPTINFRKFRDEKEMVSQFLSILHTGVACIIGFNSDGFDIPYLINRSKNIGIELEKLLPLGKYYEKGNKMTFKSYAIPGIVKLDWLNLVKKYELEKLESYSLDSVAKYYLGDEEGKIEYLSEFKSLDELYDEDYNRFIDYNMKDAMLLVDLEKKKSYVNLSFELAYKCHCLPEDVYSSMRLWDCYIYSELIQKHIVIPKDANKNRNPTGEKYEGAYVSEPDKGMKDWVAVFDVASLYPNIIIGWNMSSMTKIPMISIKDPRLLELSIRASVEYFLKEKPDLSFLKEFNYSVSANGVFYDISERDLICGILKKTFEERMRIREISVKEQNDNKKAILRNKVTALKLLMNSFYGCCGNSNFRWYDIDVATSVTVTGQYIIRKIGNDLERGLSNILDNYYNSVMKRRVYYQDTDSCYVDVNDILGDYQKKVGKKTTREESISFIKKAIYKIYFPIINQSILDICSSMNSFEQSINMVHEKTCNRILFSEKKRYIMSVVESEGKALKDNEYIYKGIEIVRTSTPKAVRDVLKETMKFLFTECKDEIDLYGYTSRVKTEVWDKLNIKEIAFPRGVSDMSEDWKPLQYDPKGNTLSFRKGTPVAVKAAWVYNFTIDKLGLKNKFPTLRNKDKVRWVYLKMPNPFHSTVMAFNAAYYFPVDPRYNLEKYVDRELQYQKAYFDVVQRLADSMGWSLERGSQRVETLF